MPHWKLSAIFRRMGEPLDVQPFQLRWPPLPVSSLMTSHHFAAFSQRARALVSDSGSDLAVAQSVQMDGFKIQSPFLDQDPSSFFWSQCSPFLRLIRRSGRIAHIEQSIVASKGSACAVCRRCQPIFSPVISKSWSHTIFHKVIIKTGLLGLNIQ